MLWREGPAVPAASQANVVSARGQAVLIAQQNPASSRAAATAMIVRRLPRRSIRVQTRCRRRWVFHDSATIAASAPVWRRRRRGRPRGSGTRSAQALALVEAKPGITIPEMAKEMGITPNYLYRILPELAKDGKVKKTGKGWEPAS